MGVDTKYDIDQMMEEWRINGLVIFEDLIPTETIDRILEAWIPVQDRDIERQGKYPPRAFHRGTPNRSDHPRSHWRSGDDRAPNL